MTRMLFSWTVHAALHVYKENIHETRVLTISAGEVITMLEKKIRTKCSSLLFYFMETAVVELCTVRCLGKGFSKQLTCYWGSYKRYLLEASILTPMIHNGVTCRMESPYQVNWHSRLKNRKRTMSKAVTKLQSRRQCC